jgi:hypothetical protein
MTPLRSIDPDHLTRIARGTRVPAVLGDDRLSASPRRFSRVHAILWPVLFVLAGVAAALQPALERLLPPLGNERLPFGDAVARYGSDWLLGTLPVLAAGALAVVLGQRGGMRPAWGSAAWLAAGSMLVEIVGGAAWLSVFDAPGLGSLAMVYAVSSILLAGAWMMVRGRRPLALATTLFAGIASWFTIPKLVGQSLYGAIRDTFGTGTLAMFVIFIAAYVLQALVIGVAVVAELAWRRVRPAAPLHAEAP